MSQGETPRKTPRKKKTVEDIKPEILIVDGVREEMYSTTDAAIYAGYSPTGFYKFLARHPEIKQHAKGYDESRKRYVKKSDLDRILEAHVVEDNGELPPEEEE